MLWFIYVVSLMVRAYGGPGSQSGRFAAVLGIVGFLDIPLIHLSVVWWRSMHPLAVVVRSEGFGSGLHPALLQALLVNVAAFTLLYVALFGIRRAQMAAFDALAARRGARVQRGAEQHGLLPHCGRIAGPDRYRAQCRREAQRHGLQRDNRA